MSLLGNNPALGVSTTASTASPSNTNQPAFVKSEGWYLLGAVVAGIAVANTPAGPVAFGILTLALIYQTSKLLEGK